MSRRFLWLLILCVTLASFAHSYSANAVDVSNYTQVFGIRPSWHQYQGVANYASAQNPGLGDPRIQPGTFGPNGMIDTTTQAFIEAGNSLFWSNAHQRFELHPYYAYQLADGTYFSRLSENLGYLNAGSYYEYAMYPTGEPNRYLARFCSGEGCEIMVDLAFYDTAAFNDVRSGGESTCPECKLGYTNTTNHHFLDGGDWNWYYYCYTYYVSQHAHNTQPSQCRPGIDPPDWSIWYEGIP